MQYLTARPAGISSFLLISSALIFIFSCKKVPPPSTSAKGFLTSAKLACSPGKVHGVWYNGISAGTDTNYVEVTLNVTSPGSYTISSGKQNGVTFSSSGTFSNIGVYRVRLSPSGAFTNWGPTSFPITFDSSSCSFLVYVQDSAALSMPANTWEMTASGNYYNGPCTGGLNLPPGQATVLTFTGTGWSGDSQDTAMAWDLSRGGSGGSILDTIPYLTDTIGTGFYIQAKDTTKSFPDSYLISASANTQTPGASMTVHIRSMVPFVTDDTYKTIVYGTFEGTARDFWHQNHIVPVTKGRFKLFY
jgi:hypothetical protein